MNKKFRVLILVLTFMFVLLGCQKIQKIQEIEGPDQVMVGQSIVLKAKSFKFFQWQVSDEDIASIEDGVLYGKSVGTVEVRVLINDKLVKTKNVRVIEAQRLYITGGSVIIVGEETKFRVQSNYFARGGTWKSENPSIATVDITGMITGISKGTTSITYEVNGLKASKNIEVLQDRAPQKIEIGFVLEEYIVGKGPYQLTATANPSFGGEEFTWEVVGEKAEINRTTGEITFLEEGELYVICRSVHSDYVHATVRLKSVYSKDVLVKTVMFVGNSLTYVNDIPYTVKKMALASDKALRTTSFTIGGNHLGQIYTSQITPLSKALDDQQFDYLIIQEASADNFTNYPRFLESAKNFAVLAQMHEVELRLYETWCYSTTSEWLDRVGMSREEMQNRITEAYEQVSEELDAVIHPVGRIFYEFSLDYPEINLYTDQNHASPIGSYLSSCVHYVSIFQESVVGNTYDAKIGLEIQQLIQQYVSNKMLGN